MAKTFYIPVNNLSKEAKTWYVPVNNLSKKVAKAYCSVNGVSKLFWDGGGEAGLLWNYTNDNNGNILYGNQTYSATLHDAIESYTKIVVEIRSYYQNNPDTFSIFPVEILSGTYIPNRTNIGTNKGVWKDRVGTFDIRGRSLQKVRDNYGNYGNSMGLVNVWGINTPIFVTTLWDYDTENSGVIPYNPTTLTLRNSVENYDQIVIEVVSLASDLTNQYGTFLFTVSVNALANAYRPHYFNHTSWNDRSSVYYMQGATFRKDANNVANTNGIVKIWGLRY